MFTLTLNCIKELFVKANLYVYKSHFMRANVV